MTDNTIEVSTSVVEAVIEVGIEAAIIAASAALPFLNYPLIKPLFAALVRFIGGFFMTAVGRIVTFAIIDHQTGEQNREFRRAVNDLESAHRSEDPERIEDAKAKFKTALADLVHFDTAPAH